jgi:adenylate kinase family enzyme
MALNVVMLGPPGAGKGTQSERFARTHGLPKIATGDILRGGGPCRTPMGLAAKATIDAGELVSDDVMIGIVGDGWRGRHAARVRARRVSADRGPGDGARRHHGGRGPLVVSTSSCRKDVLLRRLAARRICGAAASTRRSSGSRRAASAAARWSTAPTTATASWRSG